MKKISRNRCYPDQHREYIGYKQSLCLIFKEFCIFPIPPLKILEANKYPDTRANAKIWNEFSHVAIMSIPRLSKAGFSVNHVPVQKSKECPNMIMSIRIVLTNPTFSSCFLHSSIRFLSSFHLLNIHDTSIALPSKQNVDNIHLFH